MYDVETQMQKDDGINYSIWLEIWSIELIPRPHKSEILITDFMFYEYKQLFQCNIEQNSVQ